MLDFIKYAAAVLTGIFGIIALLVEPKAKDHKKARRARLALGIGVVLSTILAVSSQWLDSEKSAREQAELNLKLDRLQNPIADVYVSYAALVPPDPLLEPYRTKLDAAIRPVAAAANPRSIDPDLRAKANIYSLDKAKKPYVMSIPALSPLMPSDDQALASALLRYSGVVVYLYAASGPKQDSATHRSGTPDLVWAGVIGPDAYGRVKDMGSFLFFLNYALTAKTFTIIVMRSHPDPQNWMSTRKITAIPDLVNADMEVKLPKIGLNKEYTWSEDYARIKREFKLGELTLTMSGQQFSFPGKLFKQVSGDDGQPLFVYHFPETREGVQRLSNKSAALLPGTYAGSYEEQ